MIILIFLILCKEKMVNTRFPGRNRVPFVLKERVKGENYSLERIRSPRRFMPMSIFSGVTLP